MALSDFLELRIKQLEANITKDYELLNRVENALRTEQDPINQAKYESQVERLRESAARYKQEYDELVSKTSGEQAGELHDIGTRLRAMDTKLDSLVAGQGEIRKELGEMRQSLLDRYDMSERNIISAIIGKLDEAQIATVQDVLSDLEANRISEDEVRQTLASVQQALTTLQQPAAFPAKQEVEKIIADPSLDWKHKMKLSIPIVPAILNYEIEFSLGSGANLSTLWKRLVNKVKG